MTKKQTNDKLLVAFNSSMSGNLNARAVDFFENSEREFNYGVIDMQYLLDCGDISDVPSSNDKLYNVLCFCKTEEAVQEVESSLEVLRVCSSEQHIEIFIDPSLPGTLCNLYYFAKEFAGFSNVFLNYCHTESGRNSEGILEFYAVTDSRIPLTDNLISEFSKKWDGLVANNAAIRSSVNGEISEYTLDQAKAKILNVFTDEYERFGTLYHNFRRECGEEEVWSFDSFGHITEVLTNEGIVERIPDTNVHEYYRDMYFKQKYRIRI